MMANNGNINNGQPDPITKCRMSDDCWNSRHYGQTITRMEADGVRRKYDIGCVGWMDEGKTEQCECRCHYAEPKKKIQRGPKSEQTLMEVYGTIDIRGRDDNR